MIALYILAFILSGVVLAVCANWVVRSVSYFSQALHVKSFLLGFLLLGVATTIPEMFVAYQSVHDGVPQLAVGNLLGGSILLLSFVMGTSAIFLKRIVLDHGMRTMDIGISSLVVFAPAIMLWDGTLSRAEGALLVIVYLIHIFLINKEQQLVGHIEEHAHHVKHGGHAIFLSIVGLAGMAIASRSIVTIGEHVVQLVHMPTFVVGLFLITFGTNLPEISLAVEAVIKKKRDIAFGDILGSSVINTPILGIIGLLAPFTIADHERIRVTLLLLALVALFFYWAASSKRDVTRKEGFVLLVVYGSFVLFEMMHI